MRNFIYYITVILLSLGFNKSLAQIKCQPLITHGSCSLSTNGSIVLNSVTGGTAPYTYTWMPGATGSNSITNKGFDSYSVTIKGTGTLTTTYNFNIGYKVRWQQMYSLMSQTGDVLNAGTSSTWLNTANSSNILSGSTNGWVECVMTSTTNSYLFGLVDSVGTGWNNIDFAIMINSGGTINSCNNGVQTSIGSYLLGDVLRIERIGNSVNYKKNNITVWTTTITPTMQQSRLKIRAGVYTTGTSLANVGCNFQSVNGWAISTNTITCAVSNATLISSTNVVAATYSWSPTNTAPTSSITTVTASGTYSLKIVEPYYGCIVVNTVAVISNTTLPNISAGSNKTITCSSPSAVLTGSSSTSGVTYSWSPGGLTTTTISTSSAGTYTLRVTNSSSGCVSVATVAVISNTTLPNISAGNNQTITCSSPSAVLTGSSSTSGVTYSWSPGGLTTATISTSSAGTYTLRVTNSSSGCVSIATVAVISNTTLPNISAGSNKTITCSSPSAVLTGSSSTSGVTYSWSPGGLTTATISTSSAGTYTLRVTNSSSVCVSIATVAVISNTTLPNISAGGNKTITCSSPSAVLTGSSSTSGVTYSWSPGGLTTATISTSSAGTYTLRVTNSSSGCVSIATVAVISNTTLPNISAGNSKTITATSPVAILTGSSSTSGVTYSWNPGGVTTATMSVTTPGTYTLKVTNPVNGCISLSSTTVLLDTASFFKIYISLKKTLDAGYYNTNGNNLNIAFEEEYVDQTLNYQIVSDLNQPVSGTLPVLSSVVGDNRFQINLSSISGLTVGNYYRIKITNSKNEVWYARFKYTL